MTNFELYKPYKTRGGWCGVVVKVEDGVFIASHDAHVFCNHNMDGTAKTPSGNTYDLLEPWSEPIKRTFYIALSTMQDKVWVAQSISEAERLAKMNAGEFLKLDYVQGATHYVAKGEC